MVDCEHYSNFKYNFRKSLPNVHFRPADMLVELSLFSGGWFIFFLLPVMSQMITTPNLNSTIMSSSTSASSMSLVNTGLSSFSGASQISTAAPSTSNPANMTTGIPTTPPLTTASSTHTQSISTSTGPPGLLSTTNIATIVGSIVGVIGTISGIIFGIKKFNKKKPEQKIPQTLPSEPGFILQAADMLKLPKQS